MSAPLKWPAAQVHWHEGLFLLPHHFQLLERGLRQQMQAERRLAWSYPYGVIGASVSEGALANRVIQFKTLHAILPEGLEVRLGENAELDPLNFEEEFKQLADAQAGLQVALAVPRWDPSRSNTVEAAPDADRRVKR